MQIYYNSNDILNETNQTKRLEDKKKKKKKRNESIRKLQLLETESTYMV